MNATADLLRLMSEWHHLTECEGQAILESDWDRVLECQAGKKTLAAEIETLLASEAEADDSGSPGRGGRWIALVAELMAMETRNRDLIATRRESHAAEMARVGGSVQSLHAARRAYGAGPRSQWHSYS